MCAVEATAPRETILAIASPPGHGLRALVRMSGPGVRAAARGMFGEIPSARGVARMRVRLGDVDEARTHEFPLHGSYPVLAYWMEGPASFTGEDSLELSCVGAPALVEILCDRALASARTAGFSARRARPGEFAFRAHLAGRLDVDAAESLAARIAATNDAELIAAEEIGRGTFGIRAAELVGVAAELLARVEAGIDFTDQEDVVTIDARAFADAARELRGRIAALRGTHDSLRANAVALVVLAGPPNAGKSSLFNALVGRARSVASPQSGTTRDAIVARVALTAGLEADLVDLAGLEFGDREVVGEIEQSMQRQARDALRRADIVLRCTAPSATPISLERRDQFDLAITGEVIEVHTMCDLASAPPPPAVSTSARTGAGIAELRGRIAALLRRDRALRRAQLAIILPRHDASLVLAEDALSLAIREALPTDDSFTQVAGAHTRGESMRDLELIASLLRAALDALGDIAGPVHPDDVLGLVFSRFCIGK